MKFPVVPVVATLAAVLPVHAATLLFHAPLDGSPVAAVAAGRAEPLVAEGLEWAEGPLPGTKALRIGAPGGACLAYSAAGNLPRESGTVAFWTRRVWDFSAAEQPWRALFATPMPNGREKGRVGSGALWFWWYGSKLRADQSDAKDRYSLFNGIPPGDGWMHLAFTWRPGRTEIFVNGVRRRYLRDSDSPIRDAIAEAAAGSAVPDRSAIDRFFLGSVDGEEPADSLFSDLRIYDAPLAEEEIRELFEAARRQSAAIGRGDSASTSCGGVAPPRPSGHNPHLRAPLPGDAPGTIAPEALDLVAAVSSEELAEMAAQGNVAGAFRSIGAMRAGSLGGVPYVEAGLSKGDRFAVRLRLPAGHPLFLIEIDVPDDALRTQDMIVQPCRGGGDYALQVGLLLGGEYPNSGRMLTQKCLYWARTNDVALVAMTARDGAPAAVSAIRAYAVRDAALPASDNAGFAAGAPSPAESRHAALYYEDPALNLQFGLPAYIASTQAGFAEELSRLAAVMRFTGFDTLFYPGAWYQGLIDAGGYNPRSHAPHWREILYGAFDAGGLGFAPTINLNNIPWEPGEVTVESLSDGSLDSSPIAIHDTGKPNPGLWHNTPPNYNFFHPAVQAEIERIFDTLLEEGASHPSFRGVCLHLTKHCCLWWGSDKSGYNDYAIEAFCRDTGRNLPSGHPAFRATAETPGFLRGRAYAEWLRSDPALWNAWLQWRCDQVTAFYSRLAAKLAAAHPGAMLYVNNFVPPDLNRDDFDDPDFTRNAARGAGLDVSALEAAIPNLVVMQTAIPADYRWGYADHYFKFDDPACREEAVAFIRDHDSSPGFWTLLGETSRPWANQHDRYWESAIGARGDTLSCDWLAEHTWRVSTLNPAGDNALAHFTRPLRFHDTLGLSKGGFLVGTYGMEERLAPFALAFRSLPPAVLPELPCSTDLVKVRGGEWGGTNYLYAVNTGDAPAEVVLPEPYGKVTLA
ncbi:MAG: hypothetical protein IJ783_09585, partial [Kiritimatiellae bacterium]|nr:hypothetical protein [Kiritimatiellia bacterium]